MKALVLTVGVCLAALALTILSVFVQRVGPEQVINGNLCGASGNELCWQPALKGGLPFAFLYDYPGVSVPNKLGPEDTFVVLSFALDWACFVAAQAAIIFVWKRWQSDRYSPP